MSLKILKAGILDCIQDLGRYGYQHLGVNPGGAMDKYAAAIANILVCNKPNEAIIEMHFPAPMILFEKPALIALSGADFSATINGEPIPINQPILAPANSTIQFQSLKNKNRCYLAIHGGLGVTKWLNSYSTNLKAEAGGFSGRKLNKEDAIPYKSLSSEKILGLKVFPWKVNEDYGLNNRDKILVLAGTEWDWLIETSQEKFTKNFFYISYNSDRMGYRLASEPLHAKNKEELVSSAVNFGTIQLLPDGQLIVLMADHQTTGGYPRIGNIITAHLPVLAQMKAGDNFHFEFTTHKIAEELIVKQSQHLHQLQIACKLRLENFIHEMNLYE